jgi:hypothetical protein
MEDIMFFLINLPRDADPDEIMRVISQVIGYVNEDLYESLINNLHFFPSWSIDSYIEAAV